MMVYTFTLIIMITFGLYFNYVNLMHVHIFGKGHVSQFLKIHVGPQPND